MDNAAIALLGMGCVNISTIENVQVSIADIKGDLVSDMMEAVEELYENGVPLEGLNIIVGNDCLDYDEMPLVLPEDVHPSTNRSRGKGKTYKDWHRR